MGGIERMVHSHLRAVTDSFMNIVSSCMYDPSCSELKGACFACVQLAEVSCQNFNALLDRRTLLGESGYLHEALSLLARSLCESVGWSPDLTAGALSGNFVCQSWRRECWNSALFCRKNRVCSVWRTTFAY